MKNLRQKLREYLRLYRIRSESFTPEEIIEDPGIDYAMNESALFRQDLEKHRHLLTPEEVAVLEEADRSFLATWEKVKETEPKTPYNRIAKAFLEDIARLAQKQPARTSS